MSSHDAIKWVELWLDDIVIGLNFCPFAAKPRRQNSIKISVTNSKDTGRILHDVEQSYLLLDSHPEIETLLLVFESALHDFDDYLDHLYLAQQLGQQMGYDGVYQLASFHPDYQFEGSNPEDIENLTNRSPLPIFHFLREQSLTKITTQFPDTAAIPDKNISTLRSLSRTKIHGLFPWLTLD